MNTYIVNDEHSIINTTKSTIMQRSSLTDEVRILVPRYREGVDYVDYLVVMEYVLPVSKKYRTKELTLVDEAYKNDYLEYKIEANTKITSEPGDIEFQLSFYKVAIAEDGISTMQLVRKTSKSYIRITPIAAWSDLIPDESLTALDQRIIALHATTTQLTQLVGIALDNQPDDLKLDTDTKKVHLTVDGDKIGNGVNVDDMMSVAVSEGNEDYVTF